MIKPPPVSAAGDQSPGKYVIQILEELSHEPRFINYGVAGMIFASQFTKLGEAFPIHQETSSGDIIAAYLIKQYAF
jgi:hypothetical protein